MLCHNLLFAVNVIKYLAFSLDSQNTGNTVGRIDGVPKEAVVVASTSQVTSESDLSREKVEHAFKLLEVGSRMLRVLFTEDETLGRKGCPYAR